MANLGDIPLGKETQYPSEYDASLLFSIPREEGRNKQGIKTPLPFSGYDNWTAYEISWLDLSGKPCVVVAYFSFSCNSPNLVESKSFKLYLNSFNMSTFASQETVEALMEKDLTAASGAKVEVRLLPLASATHAVNEWRIESLDQYPLTVQASEPDANILQLNDIAVRAKLQTHLFRSLCPVTSQPDWASVRIEYHGNEIDRASLLSYLVSYRNHQGFHEQCVEQIFTDIIDVAQPDSLLIEARFLRRGGLDINPLRMKGMFEVSHRRLSRQ